MVSKYAECDADFESIEKVSKKFLTKKVSNKNVTELCSFFTLTHVRQFVLLKIFLCEFL
jgi:hypothetical protein